MSRESSRHAPFFFAEPAALDLDPLVLQGADARHLALVRRAAPGDRIFASDGQGRIVDAELMSVTPARVEAFVVTESRVQSPRPAVEVYQGLAKGDKVDGVIRQLVEVGVDVIGVFEAGRSVARWDRARAASAATRWTAIAREAAKQSHRAWMPEIRGPVRAAEAARRAAGLAALSLVAHPAAPRRLRDVLAAQGPAPPDRVWVVVGPEGGLTEAEVDLFASVGGLPVSLGDQILRTETASVVAAALLMHHFRRLG